MHSRKNPAPLSPTSSARASAPAPLAGLVALAVTAAALVVPASAQPAPPETVPIVDLRRYAGTWYEVARLPNRFQRDCLADVTATYALLPDGRIQVVNRCRTADGVDEVEGVARRADADGSPAKLEVRFAPSWLSWLPLVWGDYWVLSLAEDYSTAVVGSPDRQYLWLLSRTPTVDAPTYERLVQAARVRGYAVDELEPTRQGG